MKRLTGVILFLLLVCPGWCQDQGLSALKEAPILWSSAATLSTSDKDILCGLVDDPKSDKGVLLPAETRVRVDKRSRFVQRQTVYDRENSKSSTVERLFKVALVEVLSGAGKGKTGWIVVSYRPSGGDPVVFFAEKTAQVSKP